MSQNKRLDNLLKSFLATAKDPTEANLEKAMTGLRDYSFEQLQQAADMNIRALANVFGMGITNEMRIGMLNVLLEAMVEANMSEHEKTMMQDFIKRYEKKPA